MALESSDLNDNDILNNTKQVTQNENIQFRYTLPSGRVIHSEWISPDNRRKAIFAWVDAVKAQAVADSEAQEEEMLAKAKRERDERPIDPAVASALFGGVSADVADKPIPSPDNHPDYPPVRQASAVQQAATNVKADLIREQIQAARADVDRALIKVATWEEILAEIEGRNLS